MAQGRESVTALVNGGRQGSESGKGANVIPSDMEVMVDRKESFPSRPARPQENKAAKADLAKDGRRESILKNTTCATEQMAASNKKKVEAMEDHVAMSLFRMPIEDLDKNACEYFQLRRKWDLDCIKRRMEQENCAD